MSEIHKLHVLRAYRFEKFRITLESSKIIRVERRCHHSANELAHVVWHLFTRDLMNKFLHFTGFLVLLFVETDMAKERAETFLIESLGVEKLQKVEVQQLHILAKHLARNLRETHALTYLIDNIVHAIDRLLPHCHPFRMPELVHQLAEQFHIVLLKIIKQTALFYRRQPILKHTA